MTKRRNRPRINNEPAETHETKGGTVIQGTMRLGDLAANLDQFDLIPRPAQPWSVEEAHRRWMESTRNGHSQVFLKCQRCSLEFVLLSLRTETELLERFQPSHGQRGGLSRKVTCPECGAVGTSFLLGSRAHPRPICEFVGRATRPRGRPGTEI